MDKKVLLQVAAGLTVISAAIYALQVLIFKDPGTTAFYILQDMAFMPITIAVATLLVGYLMDEKSKAERIARSRILTSSFFSIVGCEMLEVLYSLYDPSKDKIRWDLETYVYIQTLLNDHLSEILTIASNPNLLEHESFTDLLWAALHLREEMDYYVAHKATARDENHIQGDAKRVYLLLEENWKEYADFIRKEYPYFYRTIKR